MNCSWQSPCGVPNWQSNYSTPELLRFALVIATRVRRILTSDRAGIRMEIRIFKPVIDDNSWACHYEIDWPDATRSSAAHGVDAVQALKLAMPEIGAELYASTYHTQGTLMFEKPGNGYGFPVPKPLRDDLVGDDAKFEGNA